MFEHQREEEKLSKEMTINDTVDEEQKVYNFYSSENLAWKGACFWRNLKNTV